MATTEPYRKNTARYYGTPKKRVYLVRHGQVDSNVNDTVQTLDDALTEKGRKQAEILGKRFEHVQFDALIASDAKRARDTASAIADTTKHQVELSSLFRENRFPSSLFGFPRTDEKVVAFDRGWSAHVDDPHWHFEDEENFIEVKKRAQDALAFLSDHAGDTFVVVTHGNFIRFLMGAMLFGEGMTFTEWRAIFDHFATSNTGITVIELHGDSWWLRTWNDFAHLAE